MNRRPRALRTGPSCVSACRIIGLAGFAMVLSLLRVQAQSDWPDVGHDHQAQRYSPLKQINVQNVSRLAPVWTYPLSHEADGTGSRTIESVPLVVNGHMYVSWPFCHVAA